MKPEAILELIKQELSVDELELNSLDTPSSITIGKELIKNAMLVFRDHKDLLFDQLSCLTGIDNGPEENTMEVVYNLYSIPFEHSLMVKVVLSRDNPEVSTVSDIWKTADWHEREAYDLVGIKFEGHPDLRRILLPDDWEGFPLRKDYSLQEFYHGIKVKY